MGLENDGAAMATDPKPDPADKPDPDPKPDPAKPDPATLSTADVAALKDALRIAKKEAESSRLKLKEIEDKDKSDSEKLAERVAAAEKRADEAEVRVLRAEVAVAKGLKPELHEFLTGTTREELEARADKLVLATAGQAPKPDEQKPNVSRRPNPALSGGGDPTTEPEETDPVKLASAIRGGQ